MRLPNKSIPLCSTVVNNLETAHKHGFNVIAVKDKQPVVEWKSAQEQYQTDEQVAIQCRIIESGQGDSVALVGGVNGIVAIDIDAADKSFPIPETFIQKVASRLSLAWPYQWCWRSLSGAGWHLWVTVPDLPSDATKHEVTGDGYIWRAMEIRAWKHYTVIPPNIALPNDPPAAVTWGTLCDALGVTEKQASNSHNGHNGRNGVIQINDRARVYGDKVLKNETLRVATAQEGERNNTLNRAAYRLGRLVAAKLIDKHEVEQRMQQAALQAGLSERETNATIRSGLYDGIAAGPPDSLPEFSPEQPGPTEALANALENAGYRFELNIETGDITLNGKEIDDVQIKLLRAYVRDNNLGKVSILEDAIALVADKHRVAPIRDGLNRLQWDGGSHIAKLAECLKTSSDDVITYHDKTEKRAAEVFLLRWLLGAVGRVLNGDQNAVLVLDGPQGIGKSSLTRWIGSVLDSVYCEESINPHDKDCLLRLTRTLVWEAGEIDATTRKHDVSALKHFLTRATVRVRPAYGRRDVTRPVLASFIATVNSNGNGFLPDATGNRRYLVVNLTGIDWSYQRIDIRQVWAEAVARYRKGERGTLTPEEAAFRDRMNAERNQSTGLIDDWIAEYLLITHNDSDMLTSAEIVAHLQLHGAQVGGTERTQAMAIAEALTRMGIKRANRRAAVKKYGDARRAWMGIQKKLCELCDPTFNDNPTLERIYPRGGSRHSNAVNSLYEPTVPTLIQPKPEVGSRHSNAVNSLYEPTVPTFDEKKEILGDGEVVEKVFTELRNEVGTQERFSSSESREPTYAEVGSGCSEVGTESAEVGTQSTENGSVHYKVGSFPPVDGYETDAIGPIYGKRDQYSTELFNGYLALQQKLHGTGWEVFPDYSEGLKGLYAGNRKKKLRTRTYECQSASDYVRVICNAIKCIDSDAFDRGQSELF